MLLTVHSKRQGVHSRTQERSRDTTNAFCQLKMRTTTEKKEGPKTYLIGSHIAGHAQISFRASLVVRRRAHLQILVDIPGVPTSFSCVRVCTPRLSESQCHHDEQHKRANPYIHVSLLRDSTNCDIRRLLVGCW
uniref:Uncharacterized protein n=1 Tax=Rhipicephalus appendiculatus TaxID=34631 RepID=A0A131YV08_RHIAP